MLLRLLVIYFLAWTSLFAQDYPGRDKYQSVEFIETASLDQDFDNVRVIDVRSTFEFSIIHIVGAENIPLSSTDFLERFREQASEGKKLVTYCNGHTCYKSYKAALRAINGGVKNVVAYDSGIFDWAKAHRERAELLGSSPVDPARLLSKAQLNEHTLEPEEFASRIGGGVTTIDIRGPAQRGGVGLFGINDIAIPLESRERLLTYIRKFKKNGKVLYIYDEAGRQVRWMQYLIEAEGIKNYYFMKGGAKALIATF